MLGDLLRFVLGVAVLVVGAELLVRGASGVARRTGLSSVVIGLTVVAVGTSAPEIAVSVQASLRGEPDLVIGNVVGSNIANLLLVTGLAAVVGGGLVVAKRLVRVDVIVLIVASLVVTGMAWNGMISRVEGARRVIHRRAGSPHRRRPHGPRDRRPRARSAASSMASAFGVSELVIGLTVVAVGTSAPEIATCVLAAARGQRDLAVGNAVGSSIANLLGVLGIAALVAKGGVPVAESARTFDLPVMTAAAIASLPIFASGWAVKRWEGAAFLSFYGAYLLYLVLDGTGHARADEFGRSLLASIPLLVLAATAVALRQPEEIAA